MTRSLSDDQKAALSAEIDLPGALEILIDTDQDDAQSYAEEIAATFIAAGWNVVTLPLPNTWFSTPSGVSFLAQGDLPLSTQQEDVLAGFENGEIGYSRLDAMLPEGVDVKLLVGKVGV